MDFTPTRRRDLPESIVPMINVVFLLLIFFLMTAQIAPPDPLDVRLPLSDASAEVPQDGALYMGSDGSLAFNTPQGVVYGEAALLSLVAQILEQDQLQGKGEVVLKADASVAAREVARLLPRLAVLGVGDVRLVTAEGARP